MYSRPSKQDLESLLQQMANLNSVDSQLSYNLSSVWQELNPVRTKVDNIQAANFERDSMLMRIRQNYDLINNHVGQLEQSINQLSSTINTFQHTLEDLEVCRSHWVHPQ